jgi:hypothetical protein
MGRTGFTRAITIRAPASAVWRWVVQIGQDRAGFYSNTWLENLTGADIHNADAIHPEWAAAEDRRPCPPGPPGSLRRLRLDPLDALVYTALIYEEAERIEKYRVPASRRVA